MRDVTLLRNNITSGNNFLLITKTKKLFIIEADGYVGVYRDVGADVTVDIYIGLILVW